MIPAQLISRKRDGGELTDGEIYEFIQRYSSSDLPDYQMSAMAMAIYFQGMTMRETTSLTRALLESGTTLKWNDNVPKVDKHSTGGIGDKVSLVLAPIMACCGLHVPMLSGRGLGITGGTLDKLEAINGFRTNLSVDELQRQSSKIGCAITGASQELAPADRKLYALRDVTGTVPSRPLIVSSIMSKKLAEGLDALVLDVKVGSGAFMKTEDDARLLAETLVAVGKQMGVTTTALLSDMEQPLGHAIGNAIEVQEAVETLQGGGPADVLELSLRLGSELLVATEYAESESDARQKQLAHITDGSAYEKFEEMVTAQGAKMDSLFSLASASEIRSTQAGYVHAIDSAKLGNALVELGGGRQQVQDVIDHGVGFRTLVRVGQEVTEAQPLMHVFSRDEYDADTLASAFVVKQEPRIKRTLVIDRIA